MTLRVGVTTVKEYTPAAPVAVILLFVDTTVVPGITTVFPPLMESEFELMLKLWVGNVIVLPPVMEIDPFDTLSEGLGTLTVKLLADVVTEAAPVPTPLTEAPGKTTVLPLLMVSELELIPRLWVGRATVLPFAIDKEPLEMLSDGLGTVTVKVVPVVGETVAIPIPVMCTAPVFVSVCVLTAVPWVMLSSLVALL